MRAFRFQRPPSRRGPPARSRRPPFSPPRSATTSPSPSHLPRRPLPWPRLALSLVLALHPASDLAAQWPGELAGRVVDAATARPVDGASVSVDGTGLHAVTDAAGAFRLRGVEPGAHLLVVERLGYVTVRAEVEAANGRVARVALALEPVPVPVPGLAATVRRSPAGAWVVVPREAGGAGSAGDLLRGVPGVVLARTGPGGAETVSIRGGSADAVLVLLDGTPLNDPVTGEADLSTVPASTLARVVVLPGARSARYGPRAEAGVILLETRSADLVPGASLGAGSLGLVEATAEVALPAGALRLAAGAGSRRADGRFRFEVPEAVGGGESVRRNADVRRDHGWVSAEASLAGGELRARVAGSHLERGLPGRSFAPTPEARQSERRGTTSATWSGGGGRVRLETGLDAALQEVRYRDPAPPAGLPYDETTRAASAGVRVEASAEPFAGRGATVGGGIEVRREAVRGDALSDDAPAGRTDGGLWLRGSTRLPAPGGSPRAHAAVRLQRDGLTDGLVVSHEVGLEALLGPFSVHAGHRSAYSPPTLADQYFREGVGVRPDPDLRAERVPSEVEAGVRAFLPGPGGARASFGVSAWVGDVRDMIVWAPDYRFVWSPRNVDVRRRGLEVVGEVAAPSVRGGELRLAGHYSRVRAVYDRAGDDDVQVLYRPRNVAALRLDWEGAGGAGGAVSLEARYTGLRYPVPARVNALPGFWAVDLSLSRPFRAGPVLLTPSVDVERLLGRDDALLFAFPEPGRTVSFSLGARPAGPP